MQAFYLKRYPSNNKKVIFLLGGWNNKQFLFWPLIKLFQRKGYYCILCTFNRNFFSWNIDQTVDNFNQVKDLILSEINELKRKNYKEYSVFGISLGSVLAIFIANYSNDISKVILNLIGHDITEVIWGWNKVNPEFKQGLKKNNLSKKIVKERWKSISPINNLDNLKNKEILVYLAKKDKIIPYKFGQKFLDKLKKKNLNFLVYENNFLGHYLSAIFNLLRSNIYLNFLKN